MDNIMHKEVKSSTNMARENNRKRKFSTTLVDSTDGRGSHNDHSVKPSATNTTDKSDHQEEYSPKLVNSVGDKSLPRLERKHKRFRAEKTDCKKEENFPENHVQILQRPRVHDQEFIDQLHQARPRLQAQMSFQLQQSRAQAPFLADHLADHLAGHRAGHRANHQADLNWIRFCNHVRTLSTITPPTFQRQTGSNAFVQQPTRGRGTERPRIRILNRRGAYRPQIPPISRVPDEQVGTEDPAVTRVNTYREQEEAAKGFEDDETFIPTICRQSEERSRQEAQARAYREHGQAGTFTPASYSAYMRNPLARPQGQASSQKWPAYFREQ
ncbi:hypothetical protein F4803DRAFT_551466 [Xylaria telfairii]|nr:hypothetical protein F4803DRAFT_551466 [Xylaria telfairii]